MGCDYYIITYIIIEYLDNHGNKHEAYITYSRQPGYFSFYGDSDDEDYDAKYDKYIDDVLKVTKQPITIFENNQYTSEFLKNKYRHLIIEKLNDINKMYAKREFYYDESICDYIELINNDSPSITELNLVKIVKKESRELR